MGRAKQNMELITEGRSRNLKFQKRRESLEKKAKELQILCGIEVCSIIYNPRSSEGRNSREFVTGLPNQESVQLLIDSYNKQLPEDKSRRTEGLSHYYERKRQCLENELKELKMSNKMEKYAMWDERYDNLGVEHLRQFGGLLEAKIAGVKNKIETIKGAQTRFYLDKIGNDFMLPPQQQPISSMMFNPSEITYPVNHYPTHHSHQQFVPNYPLNNNSTNSMYYNNSGHQFGGISSNNFPCDRGYLDDTTLGNFSTPGVGYSGNNNSEPQMMGPYMQLLKTDDTPVLYEQMMKNQNHTPVSYEQMMKNQNQTSWSRKF